MDSLSRISVPKSWRRIRLPVEPGPELLPYPARARSVRVQAYAQVVDSQEPNTQASFTYAEAFVAEPPTRTTYNMNRLAPCTPRIFTLVQQLIWLLI